MEYCTFCHERNCWWMRLNGYIQDEGNKIKDKLIDSGKESKDVGIVSVPVIQE